RGAGGRLRPPRPGAAKDGPLSRSIAPGIPLEDDWDSPAEADDPSARGPGRTSRLQGGRASAALRRRGLFSVGWSGLSQVITMVVRLGSTIVMTRLLAPEAYGVFATAMAVVITLEWFS